MAMRTADFLLGIAVAFMVILNILYPAIYRADPKFLGQDLDKVDYLVFAANIIGLLSFILYLASKFIIYRGDK